jgi:hypothetical protein
MSVRRIGSTQQYAEGWDRAFGKGAKTAKATKTAKKKASGSVNRMSAKKPTKKKTARSKK